MHALKLLFSNLDHFRRLFASVFVAGFLDGIAMFFFPLVLAEYAKGDLSTDDLPALFGLLLTLYVLSLVLQWILRRHGEALGPRYGLHLRLKYFRSLERLPMEDFSQFHSGYVLALISRVSDGLGGLLVEMLWGVSKSIANVMLFFIFTARESLPIAWANLGLLIAFVFVSGYLSRRMVPIAQELNIRRATLFGRYADFLANILTVKKLSLRAFAENRLQKDSESMEEQLHKFQRFHAWRWSLLHSLYGAAYLMTICYLVREVALGRQSPAILVLFVATFATLRTYVERLSEDYKWILEMNADIATLDRIVTISHHAPVSSGVDSWQEIRFKDVKYQYAANDHLIAIPEFVLRRGECVAISGMSGQGKSTFLNLLAGFLEPDAGERWIDERSYESVGSAFFRERAAFVSQEVDLFNLTLRENLLLGGSEADLSELLFELGLSEWVEQLESGLETVVGEKGMKLSSGQKQRINLARATKLNRDIYLLDEPTAHLDIDSERRVSEFIRARLADKTVVIVSHRQALMSLCSRRYKFDGGIMREVKS